MVISESSFSAGSGAPRLARSRASALRSILFSNRRVSSSSASAAADNRVEKHSRATRTRKDGSMVIGPGQKGIGRKGEPKLPPPMTRGCYCLAPPKGDFGGGGVVDTRQRLGIAAVELTFHHTVDTGERTIRGNGAGTQVQGTGGTGQAAGQSTSAAAVVGGQYARAHTGAGAGVVLVDTDNVVLGVDQGWHAGGWIFTDEPDSAVCTGHIEVSAVGWLRAALGWRPFTEIHLGTGYLGDHFTAELWIAVGRCSDLAIGVDLGVVSELVLPGPAWKLTTAAVFAVLPVMVGMAIPAVPIA
ncbi:hypothetical protein L1887_53794 [Cichorium endivia]|nr:hypothetical protein L1887_53794 [Cichorium endivia]